MRVVSNPALIRERGFALPTILIASIVMIMVLLSAVQTAISTRTALDNQYLNKVAQTAAESGTTFALRCIKEAGTGEAPWGNVATLMANMDCFGDVVGGASSYIVDTAKVKSTFSIRVSETNDNGLPISLSVQGKVSLYRQSNNQEWRSLNTSLGVKLDRNNIAVSDLASGVGATCAAVGGKAYCWGDPANGRLGNGQTSGPAQRNPQPVIEEAGVLQGRRVTQISVGHFSTCAIATLPGGAAGRAYCWGDNTHGQLGNGTVGVNNSSAKPVAVSTLGETVTKIATGRTYACAVTTSARLYCWGNNSSGQLGSGDLVSYSSPRLVAGLLTSGVKDVYAGSGTKTTCALRATSTTVDRLYCWGNNRQGQVGDGTTTTRTLPVLVPFNFGVSSGHTLNASVGGARGGSDTSYDDTTERGFVCAVGSGKRGYCWGSNRYAQTGHDPNIAVGTEGNITAPQEIYYSSYQSGGVNYSNYTRTSTQGGNIEKIVTGWGTACALRTTRPTGTAYEAVPSESQVPPDDPYHVGSPTNKALLCWGNNELTNLGLNDATATKTGYANEWTSVPLPPDANTTSSMFALRVPRHMPAFGPESQLHTAGITDLYGGGHRMCVVSGNRLYCWGNNAAGQVGSSQTTASTVGWPVLADLIEDLKDVYLY